jgi:hypothetical protein
MAEDELKREIAHLKALNAALISENQSVLNENKRLVEREGEILSILGEKGLITQQDWNEIVARRRIDAAFDRKKEAKNRPMKQAFPADEASLEPNQ